MADALQPTRYRSTRQSSSDGANAPGFAATLLEGLASDGGLYLPEAYPHIDEATLTQWRSLGYAELAFAVTRLFIDDIPADDLQRLCAKAYRAEVFGGHADIVPLKPLGEDGQFWMLGLSEGPTFAFKDLAMQWLGHLLEYELARRGERLNVLGATSGDTGSAAEVALLGRRGVQVFMLSPHGRMSAVQQAQMYGIADPHIHNIAVQGVFDDAQDMVKAVSQDLAFKRAHRIGAVNSINWARLLAQVVYYFWAYFRLLDAAVLPLGARVSFSVPSGNFGNVCAGHVARCMGLPIAQLVVATNENDVLDVFFRTGEYRLRASSDVAETNSPSMDIAKASNFERFVADLLGRDGQAVQRLFGDALGQHGAFALDAATLKRCQGEFGFVSARSTHGERLAAMREAQQQWGLWMDPHTAAGLHGARARAQSGVPMIVLETANAAKFAPAVREATGHEPPMPAALAAALQAPKRCTVMPVDVAALKQFIAEHD